MRNLILRMSIYLMPICFGSSLIAIDVPLKYVKINNENQSIYSTGRRFLDEGWEGNYFDSKLPELLDEHPFYGEATFGDTKVLMIFAQEKPGDLYYNVLYLDKNHNRDLTDDVVYRGVQIEAPDERITIIEYPAIEVDIDIDGDIFPYCFKPSVITLGRSQRRPSVAIQPYCYYLGEFQCQGRKLHIALADQTYNGRFDDSYKIQPNRRVRGGGIAGKGDTFYISDGTTFSSYDSLGLGRWLIVGDELFEVNVDMSKQRLSLTPASSTLASLRVSANPERLSLYQKDTDDFIMLYQPKEKVFLNTGWYCLYNYEMVKIDPAGDQWRLNAYGSSASPFIEVNGEGAILRLGEPYTPEIEVQYNHRNRKAAMTFLTMGLGGELVEELMRIKGNSTRIELSRVRRYLQRPKEPSYRITETNGKIVAQGNFEYG